MNRRLLNLMCLALPAGVLLPTAASAGRNPPKPSTHPQGRNPPSSTHSEEPDSVTPPEAALKTGTAQKSKTKCKPKTGPAADCVNDLKAKEKPDTVPATKN